MQPFLPVLVFVTEGAAAGADGLTANAPSAREAQLVGAAFAWETD